MQKDIALIGVPMDLGQTRRGVDMGPSAIRYAGIVERLQRLHYSVYDLGDIDVPRPKNNGQIMYSEKTLRYLDEIVITNERLAKEVDAQIIKQRRPLILGGDHSIAIGSIAGLAKHYENLGVLWYDAHGDINTVETTPSGNIHGMPLAVNLGFGHERLTSIYGHVPKLKKENIVLIGIRNLDDGEKRLLKELNIKVYTMHEIDRIGMPQVMEEAIEYLSNRTDGVHVSFDLDSIDPSEAPGVGTPEIGGLTYRESHLALEMLSEANIVTSAEFVEVNPMLDERNKTANLTVALAGSLFGEKLL